VSADPRAVEHGIKTTAGVVTSAAAVMVGAFAIYATLPILDMKEMGIGLAAAVLSRCHDRASGSAAGHDEAARRLELVPAALAQLATLTTRVPSRPKRVSTAQPASQIRPDGTPSHPFNASKLAT
jgi:RND superfamily putative drug exporter